MPPDIPPSTPADAAPCAPGDRLPRAPGGPASRVANAPSSRAAGASGSPAQGEPPPRAFGEPPPRASGETPPRAFGEPPPRAFGEPPPRAFGEPPPRAFGEPPPRAFGEPPPRAFGATPMLAQWFAAKAEHPDALLFFRMGDFFELFFEDAETAADALGIALSYRGEHQGRPVPMCGVPHHAHESYLARLIRQGHRVALVEQMETPEQAKARRAGTLRRAVVRVVTPGTLTEDGLLEAGRPAWLLALVAAEGGYGAAWLDVSTGAFETEAVAAAELPALLARLEPAEIVAPTGVHPGAVAAGVPRDPARLLCDALGLATLEGLGEFTGAEVAAAATALDYLRGTQAGALPRLAHPVPQGGRACLRMDAATRRSLEILRPARERAPDPARERASGPARERAFDTDRGGAADCLLGAVDRTLTGAGARLLAHRLAAPLAEGAAIAARHDAVAALLAAPARRAAVRAALRGAPDAARALSRLSLDRHAPRDLAAIRDAVRRAGVIAAALTGPAPAGAPGGLAEVEALPRDGGGNLPLDGGGHLPLGGGGHLARDGGDRLPRDGGGHPPRDGLSGGGGILPGLAAALRPDPDPGPDLARALAATLPARLDDPGSIAPGYDGELDALRRLRDDARGAIAALQLELARAWGIASLKVRHHQQFGYLAELPAAAGEALLRAAPAGATGAWAPVHRQTMANGHRFTCAALADLDRQLAAAAAGAAGRERRVLSTLRDRCLSAGAGIAAMAAALAEVDLHAAAAELAAEGGWCRPEITAGAEFRIRAGRHPVVEAALRRARGPAFVPNDCDLSAGRRLCLLTGPNMAGKSTYLRQNALLVVLAQAGLFVPAEAACLGLVDRLYSRVGAADDLAGGRSTFMVEMTETAAILNGAGPRSLVVLDEVGRGTATWDGLAIAWAVLEALHDRLRCRTLFATHFHELTALAGRLPELAPATMQVREWRGEVVFLHGVAPGVSARSWGLHVGRLAGVPRGVLARAAAVLAALETRAEGLDPLAGELPLFAAARPPAPASTVHPVLAALGALDLDALSPREAAAALARLQGMLGQDYAAAAHPVD